MAKFEMLHGTDDFVADLGKIARAQLTRKMLTESAPILVNEMKAKAANHHVTGDMAGSIKASSPKSTGDGMSVTVAAQGVGSNGTRNAEKMAYLEYGTYKQRPTPVVTPATNAAEPKVHAKMQQIFDAEVNQ
jgi:HK97 gp10 family phage protein